MTVAQLVQQILAAIAAARSGDWVGAITAVAGIIAALVAVPGARVGGPHPQMHAQASVESSPDVMGDLEVLCQSHAQNASTVDGRVIDVFMPLLVAWMKKLIGL